jgi:hypothetical protein
VPRQQSLGGDNCCHLGQGTPAKAFRPRGQPTALVISETKSATSQLLAQDPVLLAQILDRLLLLVIHPARDRDHHEPERIENTHRSTLSREFKKVGYRHGGQRVRVSGHYGIPVLLGASGS